MTKFLLTVDYNGGVIDTPMTEWAAEDIKAHMAYYTALNEQLQASGELVEHLALTWPEEAKTDHLGRQGGPGRHRRPVRGVQGDARGLPDG